MPNRILKESICTSPTIELLDEAEEVFWHRLIVQLDDHGRFDARPAVLRSRCFPLRLERVTEEMVMEWLLKFARVGLIRLYEVDDRPYLEARTWRKHQQVRAATSKFPQPPATDSNGQQALADVPVFVFENRNRKRIGSDVEDADQAKDEIFEALVEVSHWDLSNLTRDARGETNRAAKQLRDVDATAPLIRGFEDIWTTAHPDIPVRPQIVVNHWADYMAGNIKPLERRRA
jgi:hypothetical protein